MIRSRKCQKQHHCCLYCGGAVQTYVKSGKFRRGDVGLFWDVTNADVDILMSLWRNIDFYKKKKNCSKFYGIISRGMAVKN